MIKELILFQKEAAKTDVLLTENDKKERNLALLESIRLRPRWQHKCPSVPGPITPEDQNESTVFCIELLSLSMLIPFLPSLPKFIGNTECDRVVIL